jgi:uncharacterized protein YabN with tetrapyrrole methylase and pyrophosphatase domain
MAGLTIVGLGPARPEMITVEAQGVLRRAQTAGWRTYGLAHAREVVASIAPDLSVRSLDYLYGLEGVDRPTAYRDLAEMLVRRVQVDQLDVAYLVAGSPLFINDAVLRIRDLCEQANLSLRIVHGVSFLDLILDRVYWTGWTGLQMYSAWNIARDGMELNHNAPAILFQLGEFSAGGDALDESRSLGMLEEVRDRLLKRYPPEHPVVVLYSSGCPEYQSLSKAINLSSLAEVAVPVYSNLWVPALDGPSIERRMAPESA